MVEQKQLIKVLSNLPFARLIHCFRMAVDPTKMTIAMSGIVIVCLVGWVMDVCSVMGGGGKDSAAMLRPAVAEVTSFGYAARVDVYATDTVKTMAAIELYKKSKPGKGVFSTLWNFGAARFNAATVALISADIPDLFANLWLCVAGVLWAIKYHPIYSIVFVMIVFPVVCISGGAICRVAALEFARGEKAGLGEALRFARVKFGSLLSGPAISFGLIAFFGLFVFALGLIGNIPWVGEILMAIGFPLGLVFGVLTVLMLIGTVGGLGFMFPVIAYEGSDGLDAVGRSVSYIFIKPWRGMCYTLIAAVEGTIGYLFARFTAYLLLIVTYVLLDLGVFVRAGGNDKLSAIWGKPRFLDLVVANSDVAMNWSQAVSSFLIHLSVLFVIGLVVAFVISFYFCAGTVIYSLMRSSVDDVETSVVYVPIDKIMDRAVGEPAES